MQNEILKQLKGNIIISVQAMPNEPLYDEVCINALIKSVISGGAKGLRVAGERDVKNAKNLTNVPVIGITKPSKIPVNYKELVYITPSTKDAEKLINVTKEAVDIANDLKLPVIIHSRDAVNDTIDVSPMISWISNNIATKLYQHKLSCIINQYTLSGEMYTILITNNSAEPITKITRDVLDNAVRITGYLESNIFGTPETIILSIYPTDTQNSNYEDPSWTDPIYRLICYMPNQGGLFNVEVTRSEFANLSDTVIEL